MYISNKSIVRGLVGLCTSGVLAGALYFAKNYDCVQRWKEDALYNYAISERQSSTQTMLETVASRVDSMNPQELKAAADLCDQVRDRVQLQFAVQLNTIGERNYTEAERSALRSVVRSLDGELEHYCNFANELQLTD